MASLTKAKILAAEDFPLTVVEVPEWGGSVNLKALSINDTIGIEKLKPELHESFYVPIYLSFAIVDDDRRRLFSSVEAIEELGGRNAETLLRLYYRALEIDGRKVSKDGGQDGPSAPQDGGPGGPALD